MSQTLFFVKMHGLGNDYIYFDCFESGIDDPAELSRKLSDRRTGVGGDGIILITKSKQADCGMRIFNADGSEARMCGNGIRCVGKYVYDSGNSTNRRLTVETLSGIRSVEILESAGKESSVAVDMGEPRFRPGDIPALLTGDEVTNHPLAIGDEQVTINCVSMGNPHAVIFVPEITDHQVLELGPQIERHSIFPDRINVEFVKVDSRGHLTMRVWERGSGETSACGTGACAVLVAAHRAGFCDRRATVSLPGGDLVIEWGVDNRVTMVGPAVEVFRGVVEL